MKREPDLCCRMGWRFVSYVVQSGRVTLQIEPMVSSPDIVYVPDLAHWVSSCPSWAIEIRSVVLDALTSTPWNRDLSWKECAVPLCAEEVIPCTMEDTPGGRWLLQQDLFAPGSAVSREEATAAWLQAVEFFAEQAKGRVCLAKTECVPGSVFEQVERPLLERNPEVVLEYL